MSIRDYQYRAEKYFVDDIQSASIPCTPLSNTLKVLDLKDKAVSEMLIKFLNRKLLLSLLSYVKKECSFSEYLKLAKQEQIDRRAFLYAESKRKATLEAKAQLKLKLASDAKRKAAEDKQRAYDSDPRNIARAKQIALRDALREKYELEHYIERHHFPRLMKILQKVDEEIRLTEKDVVWLSLDGDEYFTKPLKIAFHSIEAVFYADEFKNKKDPWLAVNASSHYRKCGKSITADQLLSTIKVKQLKSLKLQSALYTTHGGVKRDLSNSQAALTLGELAHKLTKNDFRPCTLLGAVNMENGSYDLGQAWYAKAIENGFSEKAMDSELRSIYFRLSKSEKDALRSHLHGIDLQRYKWAK
jgi:hypothetical protein